MNAKYQVVLQVYRQESARTVAGVLEGHLTDTPR